MDISSLKQNSNIMNIDVVTVALSAFVSFLVALTSFIFGYIRHRREMKAVLNKIHEEISLELIKERIVPYCELMQELKKVSTYKRSKEIDMFHKELLEVKEYIHNALYSKVGILSSHDTRQFMRLARIGIDEYFDKLIDFNDLKNIIWALHFSLRGDLGIKQPHWDSEIEAFRKEKISLQQKELSRLLKSDYWDFIRIDSVFHEKKQDTPADT